MDNRPRYLSPGYLHRVISTPLSLTVISDRYLYTVISHCVISHRVTSHRVISHRVISHRVISHRVISHRYHLGMKPKDDQGNCTATDSWLLILTSSSIVKFSLGVEVPAVRSIMRSYDLDLHSMSVDFNNSRIFFTDQSTNQVKVITDYGDAEILFIEEGIFKQIKSISYDWVSDRLFYVYASSGTKDAAADQIRFRKLSGVSTSEIVLKTKDDITSLWVHPTYSYIFYTTEKGEAVRCTVIGSKCTTIYKNSNGHTLSVTTDPMGDTVYLSSIREIVVTDLEGKNPRTVHTYEEGARPPRPNLAVLGGSYFWVEADKESDILMVVHGEALPSPRHELYSQPNSLFNFPINPMMLGYLAMSTGGSCTLPHPYPSPVFDSQPILKSMAKTGLLTQGHCPQINLFKVVPKSLNADDTTRFSGWRRVTQHRPIYWTGAPGPTLSCGFTYNPRHQVCNQSELVIEVTWLQLDENQGPVFTNNIMPSHVVSTSHLYSMPSHVVEDYTVEISPPIILPYHNSHSDLISLITPPQVEDYTVEISPSGAYDNEYQDKGGGKLVTERVYYARMPIYRDARGKGFCPVNRGARCPVYLIGVGYEYIRIFGEVYPPGKSGSGCMRASSASISNILFCRHFTMYHCMWGDTVQLYCLCSNGLVVLRKRPESAVIGKIGLIGL
eukprot:sb/3479351/